MHALASKDLLMRWLQQFSRLLRPRHDCRATRQKGVDCAQHVHLGAMYALRVCSMFVKASLLGAKTVAPLPAAGSTSARLPRWMACTRKSRPGVACAAAKKDVWQLCAHTHAWS